MKASTGFHSLQENLKQDTSGQYNDSNDVFPFLTGKFEAVSDQMRLSYTPDVSIPYRKIWSRRLRQYNFYILAFPFLTGKFEASRVFCLFCWWSNSFHSLQENLKPTQWITFPLRLRVSIPYRKIWSTRRNMGDPLRTRFPFLTGKFEASPPCSLFSHFLWFPFLTGKFEANNQSSLGRIPYGFHSLQENLKQKHYRMG